MALGDRQTADESRECQRTPTIAAPTPARASPDPTEVMRTVPCSSCNAEDPRQHMRAETIALCRTGASRPSAAFGHDRPDDPSRQQDRCPAERH